MSESQKLIADEQFFIAMWEILRADAAMHVPAEIDPVAEWQRMKIVSPSGAWSGLREAVADLLEMTQDVGGAQLAAIDALLATRGAPSLTAKRLERRRWLGRLLKRGSLESDEEYRVLRGKLDDVDDATFAESQRNLAKDMLLQYEARRRT